MPKDNRTKKEGLYLTCLATSPRGIVRLIVKKETPIEGYIIFKQEYVYRNILNILDKTKY